MHQEQGQIKLREADGIKHLIKLLDMDYASVIQQYAAWALANLAIDGRIYVDYEVNAEVDENKKVIGELGGIEALVFLIGAPLDLDVPEQATKALTNLALDGMLGMYGMCGVDCDGWR